LGWDENQRMMLRDKTLTVDLEKLFSRAWSATVFLCSCCSAQDTASRTPSYVLWTLC